MRRAIALAALLMPMAALAQRAPETDRLVDEARAAQVAGDTARALAALEQAAIAAPQDPEVLRLLGTSQGQAGRTEEALATLDRAARLAPADRDISLAIGRVRYYRGEHREALRIAETVLAEAPDNGDARSLADSARRALAGSDREPRWQLDWTASYSDFEKDARRRWLEGSMALGYRADPRTSITGRIDVADRFGATDVYGEARIDHGFGNGRSGYLALGATPGADFLPQWALMGGLAMRAWQSPAGDGVLTIDGRHADYRTGSVETLSPGLEYYLPGGRAWMTGKLIVTWDENGHRQSGYLMRGDAQVSDRTRLFVGYADAPETVANITLSTRTWFAGGILDLSDRITLRLDYAHDDRERSYVRHAFTAGIGLRF